MRIPRLRSKDPPRKTRSATRALPQTTMGSFAL
jgi:hypothetical protein